MSNGKQTTKREKEVHGFSHIKSRDYIHEYLLTKNGLRVLFVSLPGSPTVTTNIVYHIGSQDEAYGETGLAHMLEHMLFKPTLTKGLAWKKLEEKGAVLNATTWLDRTLYYFNLPKEYLGEMLDVEADRMRNLTITDEEFLPERANVLSEYEMYNSKPESALDWNMAGTAFQAHGYGHDTIGFRADIEAFTTAKLKAFYDRYYWPNNATLIVVGDVPVHEVLTSIHTHFAHIPGNFDPALRSHSIEQKQEGTRRVELARETPVRACMMAFKAPPFTSREWTALNLGLRHLTLGETSVLHRALVDTQLATSVDAHLYPTKDPYLALFEIYATEKGSYEKIEHVVLGAIDTLHKKPLSTTELTLLKTFDRAQELVSRDGTFNIAAQLGEYVATGAWERYFDGLAELKGITATEVQAAARTYLQKAHMTIGTIVKKN